MNRLPVFGLFLILLVGCAVTTAPNGMSWDEYHAARYNLIVTYQADEVAACKELGQVRGSSYDDGSAAKDAAQEQAVLIGGNTLLFTNLWTEWQIYQPFRYLRELHQADATVYHCSI